MTASPSISPWIGTPDGNEATVFVELKCAEGMAGPPSFLRTTSPMRGNTQSLPLATLLTPIAIGCGDTQPSQIAIRSSGLSSHLGGIGSIRGAFIAALMIGTIDTFGGVPAMLGSGYDTIDQRSHSWICSGAALSNGAIGAPTIGKSTMAIFNNV